MWFVLDRRRKRVGMIDNEVPKLLPLLSDTLHRQLENGYETLEFTVPSNHAKTGILEKEGFIVYTADRAKFRLFRIKEMDEAHGLSMVTQVFCETASTSDLMADAVRPITFNSTSIYNIVSTLLSPTGWVVGECRSDVMIDITFDDYPTILEAVRAAVLKAELEMEFTVEVDKQGRILRMLLNLYDKRGRVTNEIFEYEKNLQGVKRKVDTNNLVTALIAVGGEDANGKQITVADAAVTPPAPFEIVNDYVGDTDALAEWGNDGKHIFGVYTNTDAQNPVDLYNSTLVELKKRNKPNVTYEIDASLIKVNPDIGDTILAKDWTFPQPLFINARVLELDTSITDPSSDSFVLGEFVPVVANPIAAIQKLQKTVNQKEAAWDAAKAKADQAAKDAAEAKNVITTKIEGVQQFNNGQGTIVYRAAVFRNGEEIDNDGSTLYYLWTMYDNTNVKIEGFERSGKTLTLAATDFNKRVDLDCTVFELEELSN